MYRPPQNTNRVKSIKSKFENIESQAKNNDLLLASKNGIRNNLNKFPNFNGKLNNNDVLPANPLNIKTNPSTSKTKVMRLSQKLTNSSNSQPTQTILNDDVESATAKFPPKSNSVSGYSPNKLIQIINAHEKIEDRILDPLEGSNKPRLDRQFSDPMKRNIKRTPAFRVDKNSDNSPGFQRNVYNRNTLFDKKVKQFNSVKTCDKSNLIDKNSSDSECIPSSTSTSAGSSPGSSNGVFKNNKSFTRPTLIKSKSSHNFYSTTRFDSEVRKTVVKNCQDNVLKHIDMSLLYTEPIPKALRQKNCKDDGIIKQAENIKSIYNNSTLKLTDKNEFIDCLKRSLVEDLPPGLTDSLRYALKKPLPNGPPPQKPPRTFQHAENGEEPPEKNKSFLHVISRDLESRLTQKPKSSPRTSPSKRGDPKYMLSKLENALKNNKLRARRPARVELSTTSGEDSDDSLLFRSKSCRTLPKVPQLNCSLPSSTTNLTENLFGDFNCLHAINCTNPAYEKVKEPTSSFFVDCKSSGEPIYAEPYNHFSSFGKERKDSTASSKENRNSLYYMSTSLLAQKHLADLNDEVECQENQKKEFTNKFDDLRLGLETGVNKQTSAENSSLSSFTSDLDLTPSPVVDDPYTKIRCIIEAFESNKIKSLKKAKTSSAPFYDNVPMLEHNLEKQLYGKSIKPEKVGNFPTDPVYSSPNNITLLSRKPEKMEAFPSVPVYSSPSSSSSSSPLSERLPPISTNSRVEALQKSLTMTLERSFNNDNDVENGKDSESEKCETGKVTDIIKKFQTYIKAAPKYRQPQVTKDTLFYCCLVIEKVGDCVQIKDKYPENAEIPPDIEVLCFPESTDTPPLEAQDCTKSNTYSILLTNEKGERTFGYCRRVLPEGSSHYLPLAYCILSKYRAPKFYMNVLTELESRHGMQNKYRRELITQFYCKKFPNPGESIAIDLTQIDPSNVSSNLQGKESSSVPNYVSCEGKKTELIITRPQDNRYDDADLKTLHKLPSNILLKVFSSLLLERKVIFISSVMSKLSSSVDALQSILYPFTWYHTFIPILPEALWDIVESPTPVICGVLSTDAILDRRIENGMVVNLDTETVLQEEGDEKKILCESMKTVWKRSIALAKKSESDREIVQSVYLADAYLRVFISCLKNYRKFIVDGRFNKEEFLKSESNKNKKRFLKMFTETCMFYAFMDTALSSSENLTEFDKKIMMYGSENSDVVLDKLLAWKR